MLRCLIFSRKQYSSPPRHKKNKKVSKFILQYCTFYWYKEDFLLKESKLVITATSSLCHFFFIEVYCTATSIL